MKTFLTVAIVSASLAASTTRVLAQTDFSGRWVLDKEISADLTRASFEPQRVQPRRNAGFSGGGLGRGGFGGRRVGSGGDGGGGYGTTVTPEERARLKEFADYVKSFTAITIEQTDHSTFSVTDATGRSRLFPTDGAKTPTALASSTVDSVTKPDGQHIVTTFAIGPSEDLVFTYILVPATKQMALRIRFDESGRQRADVPELRLVYRLAR